MVKEYAEYAAKGIRTIREGRNGQIVIVPNKADDISAEEVNKSLVPIETMVVNTIKKHLDGKEIIIRGIDAVTTKEDVVSAVLNKLEIEPQDCKAGNLRPYFECNHSITVTIERSKTDKLLLAGEIKIGLNTCSVTEWIPVTQCYRCWEFGHTRVNCRTEKQ
ncbi:uncharacterized protein LOC108911577 [Anoplophora glabripennis]|uniref:uncharacterized protein LOC108911577 n=1 Tax=Anoplophora glabripennis TaxID=217634 RepID=UPI0008759B61|nr:uncharacterized protein LOC108911577 [Anoplophora glabripennis]